jgi:RNA polymerase sigma factor (sigma-70 family)
MVQPWLASISREIARNEHDIEEVLQLGRIHVEEAANDYNGKIRFLNFLAFTFRRRINTWYRSTEKIGRCRDAFRGVQYMSQMLPPSGDDDIDVGFADTDTPSPLQSLLGDEQRAIITKLATKLSPLEVEVMNLWLERATYEEIGAKLDIDARAVDNALVRAKRKGRTLYLKGFFGEVVE